MKLGVPSKGRLMEKTFDWFGSRGVGLRKSGSDREYAGAVDGIDGIELVLLSAGEIPRELAAGNIHLGVTGTDLVREKLANWDTRVAELAPMGFGGADLIMIWTPLLPRFVPSLGSVCALPRSTTGWCVTFCVPKGSRIISWWIVRVRPKAPSRTRPPRRLRISPRPGKPSARMV